MDTALIFILSAISLIMIILAIVILTGKGDGLIAGYNTAREEERNRFNTKRLRAVTAAMILFTLAFVWLVALIDSPVVIFLVCLPVLFGFYIVCIVITDKWCKKK